ncbi:YfcC family protein [Ginsengibacter hankyongi]|uniref:YfcC family protein n=1 Tax=Ginsengibacter hankyongi TaxID=2607284 RepID=A0A5J5IPA1_9BACT|nr:YfcC family protein [Ginsengibacter hankyongi]KAA9042153.1 YfcC family protein [Ginsengibacter hankyongi]
MKIIRLKSLPTPLTLMMLAIILAAITTWLLPAGQYSKLSADGNKGFVISSASGTVTLPFRQRTLDSLSIKILLQKFINGDIRKPISVPNTYQKLGNRPQGIVQILQAPVKGIIDSIDIVLFILFIGGFMSVFNKTGAMFRGVKYLAQRMNGKERLLIVILVFIFSFLGGSYGMDVESIVFYPVLVPLFMAAAYDVMVPLAIVFGGAATGFIASFTNPFSAIIASNAAGINWINGLYERLLFFGIATTLLAWYILRYAAKVKKDPLNSIVYKTDGITKSPFEMQVDAGEMLVKLGTKTKLLLLIFMLTFTSMIVGIVFFNWWTTEMSALFFASSILVAIIDRMKEKTFVMEFVKGAENLLSVALIVGLARGVTIVLNAGLVGDSILFYASNLVQHFSPVIFILLLMLFYFFFAILVSSSSGMAVLTMPIIGALAIIMNIPGREIVNSYLFGIGIMFLISPTGSVFPALLMVQVSYKAWLKFITPFIIVLFILSALFLITGINF